MKIGFDGSKDTGLLDAPTGSPGKRSAKGNRHLAKNGARTAPTKASFNPVDHLDYFNLARQNGKERRLSPLMNCKFSGIQV